MNSRAMPAPLLSRFTAIATAFFLIASGAPYAGAQTQGAEGVIPTPEPAEVPIPAPVFSASVTGASNYIFRGVSQTDNGAAIFGAARVSYDHFYLATGMENVNFGNSITAEYDFSGGWTPRFGTLHLNLGVVRYGYIGQSGGASIDTVELHGGVSRKFGPLWLGAAANYAFDYFGTHAAGTYYEANAAATITPQLTASGALGRQQINAGNSYTTWNMGAGYVLTKHVAVSLRYTDSDAHANERLDHHHFVTGMKLGF